MSKQEEPAQQRYEIPVTDAPRQSDPQEDDSKTPFDTFGAEFRKFWDSFRDDWRLRIDFLGLIVLSIYAGLTYALWDSTRTTLHEIQQQTPAVIGSANAAREAAEATKQQSIVAEAGQRAYIFIHARLGEETQPMLGHIVKIIYTLENIGQTPAIHLYDGYNVKISKSIPGIDLDGMIPPSIGFLGPHMETGAKFPQEAWLDGQSGYGKRVWKQEDLDMLKPGTGYRLYVRIIAKYQTVFGKNGETTLCGYWENIALTLCDSGNDLK
jgi:hypothetical protein